LIFASRMAGQLLSSRTLRRTSAKGPGGDDTIPPDELDLAKLGFGGVEPQATGRPVYHPATLLKIYVYGYLNRVQSSRRLERECQRNIDLTRVCVRCWGWRRPTSSCGERQKAQSGNIKLPVDGIGGRSHI
jgi:transposase-like protein DUF772